MAEMINDMMDGAMSALSPFDGPLPGEVKLDPLTSVSKDDDGKPMIASLVLAYFPRALEAVAEVSKFGLEKYKAKPEDQGWRKVKDGERRYTDAHIRHLFDVLKGYIFNPKDGQVRHRAQVAWNALAALELEIVRTEGRHG